jgi:hypothetical protein
MENKIQTRRFNIRSLLAIITGLSQGGKYSCELQELFDFLQVEGGIEARKIILLKQFPQLVNAEKDLTNEEIEILRAGSNTRIDSILVDWINIQIAKYGECFDVSPVLKD